jgi:hypothetical protein
MGDDAPQRPKTVPGFGPPPQPLPPIEFQSLPLEDPRVVDPTASPAVAPEMDSAAQTREPRPRELRVVEHASVPSMPMLHSSAPSGSGGQSRPLPQGPPAVDIDLIYERRTAPLPDQPWCFLEIWTRNTIYQLDASLVCIDVIDQASRRSIGHHPLRGARLVGGQSRGSDGMEISHPFPRPGSEAVFEQSAGRQVRFSQTSTVTRVVMRLRVLKVEPEQLLPTWEEVSSKLDSRSDKPRK